jgi:hypothetical protein
MPCSVLQLILKPSSVVIPEPDTRYLPVWCLPDFVLPNYGLADWQDEWIFDTDSKLPFMDKEMLKVLRLTCRSLKDKLRSMGCGFIVISNLTELIEMGCLG